MIIKDKISSEEQEKYLLNVDELGEAKECYFCRSRQVSNSFLLPVNAENFRHGADCFMLQEFDMQKKCISKCEFERQLWRDLQRRQAVQNLKEAIVGNLLPLRRWLVRELSKGVLRQSVYVGFVRMLLCVPCRCKTLEGQLEHSIWAMVILWWVVFIGSWLPYWLTSVIQNLL